MWMVFKKSLAPWWILLFSCLMGVSSWLKFSSDSHITDSVWSLLRSPMLALQIYQTAGLARTIVLTTSWIQVYWFLSLLTFLWSSCLISGSKNQFQSKTRHWQLSKTYTNDPNKHTCLIRNRCKYNCPNIFGISYLVGTLSKLCCNF